MRRVNKKFLSVILLVASFLFCPVNADERVMEKKIVSSTIFDSFEVDGISLEATLAKIQKKCDGIAKQMKYSPLKFTFDESLKNKKVVFKTSTLSLRTILLVIAEQVGADIVYKDKEVRISRGVWDAIE